MEDHTTATPADPTAALGQRSLLTIFLRRRWLVVIVTVGVFVPSCLVGALQPKVYQAVAALLITEPPRTMPSEFQTPAELFAQSESELPLHMRLIRGPGIGEKVKANLEGRGVKGLGDPAALAAGIRAEPVEKSRTAYSRSNILLVRYEDTVADRAQQIASEWVTVYAEESKARQGQSLDAAIRYVDKQKKTMEGTLEDIDEKLAGLRNGFSSGQDGRIADTEGGQLRLALIESRRQQAASRGKADHLRALLGRTPTRVEQIESKPSIALEATQQALMRLQLQREQLLESYRPEAPEVREVEARLAELEAHSRRTAGERREVATSVANPEIVKLTDSLTSLTGEIAGLQAEETTISEKLAEREAGVKGVESRAVKLERQERVLRETYSLLLSRLYALEIEKAMQVPTVQVAQPAALPRHPIRPNTRALAVMGLLIGLLLGIALAVVVDQLEDTFLNVEEIASYTGRRVLGVIPYARDIAERPLPVVDDPRTAFANAVRHLASNIRFLMRPGSPCVIVVTSAGRADGKTTVVANLAVALAVAGEKVLVVDGDLHRPALHTLFDAPRDTGLSNVLAGRLQPEQAMVATAIPSVKFIASGPVPPSPSDLLGTEASRELIDQINRLATVVIWDTPPAGVLPDAKLVGRHADLRLFVVGGRSRRRAVRQTLADLIGIGMDITGIVANQTRPIGPGYYYHYYQYYHYDYYSSSEKGEA